MCPSECLQDLYSLFIYVCFISCVIVLHVKCVNNKMSHGERDDGEGEGGGERRMGLLSALRFVGLSSSIVLLLEALLRCPTASGSIEKERLWHSFC